MKVKLKRKTPVKKIGVKKTTTVKAKKVVKKSDENVVYVKETIPYDPVKHGWTYSNTTIRTTNAKGNKYNAICFSSMPTGCGLYLIWGITWFCKANIEDAKNVIEQVKRNIGDKTCIATLGDAYIRPKGVMKELGFEEATDFFNSGHRAGGKYRQTIYILRNHKYYPKPEDE